MIDDLFNNKLYDSWPQVLSQYNEIPRKYCDDLKIIPLMKSAFCGGVADMVDTVFQ